MKYDIVGEYEGVPIKRYYTVDDGEPESLFIVIDISATPPRERNDDTPGRIVRVFQNEERAHSWVRRMDRLGVRTEEVLHDYDYEGMFVCQEFYEEYDPCGRGPFSDYRIVEVMYDTWDYSL